MPQGTRWRSPVADLRAHGGVAGVLEQGLGMAAQQQQRHQVLEHRAAPRHQRRAALDADERAREPEPVLLRHLDRGRWRGSSPGVPPTPAGRSASRRGDPGPFGVGQAEADREHAALPVEQELPLHRVGETVAAAGEVPQASAQRVRPGSACRPAARSSACDQQPRPGRDLVGAGARRARPPRPARSAARNDRPRARAAASRRGARRRPARSDASSASSSCRAASQRARSGVARVRWRRRAAPTLRPARVAVSAAPAQQRAPRRRVARRRARAARPRASSGRPPDCRCPPSTRSAAAAAPGCSCRTS